MGCSRPCGMRRSSRFRCGGPAAASITAGATALGVGATAASVAVVLVGEVVAAVGEAAVAAVQASAAAAGGERSRAFLFFFSSGLLQSAVCLLLPRCVEKCGRGAEGALRTGVRWCVPAACARKQRPGVYSIAA